MPQVKRHVRYARTRTANKAEIKIVRFIADRDDALASGLYKRVGNRYKDQNGNFYDNLDDVVSNYRLLVEEGVIGKYIPGYN